MQRTPYRFISLLILLVFTPQLALSTTLLGMDFDQLAQKAELIIEGEVVDIQSLRDGRSGIINSYVTFRISDVIKGNFQEALLELKFAGGSFDGEIVEVTGSIIPELGETGVYFIESASRDLLNPLLGWSQGHFVIKESNGELRVHTANSQAVIEVQPVSNIPLTIKAPQALIQTKEGIAAGVLVESSELQGNQALTLEEFKSKVRSMIEP